MAEPAASASFAAAAIILAGGSSARMGQDKAMLEVHGRPLIQHVYEQLAPHFVEVLVSAADPSSYSFLGVRVVPDRVPGQGPLMAMASALEQSPRDLNLVVACDIPTMNLGLIRRLLREAEGFDAAVPVVGEDFWEPLFAVYCRSILPAVNQALQAGHRRVRAVFRHARVCRVGLAEAPWLRNINTPEDHLSLIEELGSGESR